MKHIPGHGLVVDQPPLTRPDKAGKVTEARQRRAETISQAEAYLLEQGLDPWEIADMDLSSRTRHAWWTEEAGFVPPDHPGARPVLVVDMPVADEPPPPRTPIEIPRDR